LPEKFIVVEVAIARSNSPRAEPIFVIEVTKPHVSSVSRRKNLITKGDAICLGPTTVPSSIARVMAINEHSALPTHIAPVKTASTLRHRDCRQCYEQK